MVRPTSNPRHIETALRMFAGADSLGRLGMELERAGCRRAVIVSGPTLARGGHLDRIRDSVAGRCAGVFDGVQPHSPRPAVERAADDLREAGADAVIAVGGGSAIVTARAASIFLAEGCDLEALSSFRDSRGRLQSRRLRAPKIPQFVVPTTPSTATVKAGSAVVEPATATRMTMFDPKTRAQAVFVDPDLVMSAPPNLVLEAALDTLTIAIEGLVSHAGDVFSDALLIHGVRTFVEDLPRLATGDGPEMRIGLVMTAALCARGTDHTNVGVATVLGHSIGLACGLPNGLAKAALLPHVLRFNAGFVRDGMHRLATALVPDRPGSDPLDGIIARLDGLCRQLGVAPRLRDLGVPSHALAQIAERGMDDWFLEGNPRPVQNSAALLGLLEAAW